MIRTVMVIEDSELEAQMLERGLRAVLSRTSVVHAHSTTEAERYLFLDAKLAGGKRANPDLVFLDVKIPPAGGIDFLRRLRADPRTRSIPVIMLSGQMREEDVRDLYLSGANSYLDKPVDSHDFTTLVGSAAKYWLKLNLSASLGR